ncbi:hypothetical protein VE03_05017 [Pseudogymnoascus sp. 23342-1-I1]|nr:hypothetical protein VE03_05017 [Pseudogymnoascus sp. 23342-1-I1]
MGLRQIIAALTGTSDNQALGNRKSGKNNIEINVNTPAVIANPSTKKNKPTLIARTHGEGSSSDSKGGIRNGDETSAGNESKRDKAGENKNGQNTNESKGN